MNDDILKGKLKELKGSVKEKWGKLIDNELEMVEGKGEKLLGLLQKKYGYIRDKKELEYKDSAELAEIVSRIREIRTEKNGIATIASIARYGRPLLANNQENRITRKEKKNGHDTDRYFDSRLSRRDTSLASQ
jgi:uncharacterized protein YjbJ (UPF0337 family)